MTDANTEIREKLEARLAKLTRRVDAIERDLRKPGNQDWQESATEHENDEVLEGLDEAGLKELTQIRAALQRLSDGVYGMCIRCGEDIAPRRLEVMPAATACVTCASEMA